MQTENATAAAPATAAAKPAPALTCNPVSIAANIKSHIAALEADANTLTPLLGFALTNLRGAQSALEGHLVNVAQAAEKAAQAAQAAATAAA